MVDGRVSGGIGGALGGAGVGSAYGPVGTVVGGILGGIGGALAGGDNSAEKIAERQVKIEEIESQQRLRDMRREMSMILGQGRGATYASGLQMDGSSQSYLNMLESNFRSDIAWDRMRSELSKQIIEKGGQTAQRGYESQLLQGAIGALGNIPGIAKSFGSSPAPSPSGGLGNVSGWAAADRSG